MRIKATGLAMALLLLCALVPACSRRHKKEPAPAPDVSADAAPPAPKPKQYRAWCNSEKKPLGGWHVDPSRAEAQRASHNRVFPHHPVRIDVGE